MNESTRVMLGYTEHFGLTAFQRGGLGGDMLDVAKQKSDEYDVPVLVIELDANGQIPETLVEQVAQRMYEAEAKDKWENAAIVAKRYCISVARPALTSLLSPSK